MTHYVNESKADSAQRERRKSIQAEREDQGVEKTGREECGKKGREHGIVEQGGMRNRRGDCAQGRREEQANKTARREREREETQAHRDRERIGEQSPNRRRLLL